MTSALVMSLPTAGAPALAADLAAVGIHVLGAVTRSNMVREAVRTPPDVLVCFESQPDAVFFSDLQLLAATAPCPVLVFTTDGDAAKIERAIAAGVHAYVINGYGMHRLRALVHGAQARFRHEQALRHELAEVSHRFEERKLVDRAKGILMRARQMSEDDAFRLLRTASMHSHQRVGQVSQQVIDAAHYADAVNRAGQLRMLSQRLVKTVALIALGVEPHRSAARLADSFERVEDNLAVLTRNLSKPSFGDLVQAVLAAWGRLKPALAPPIQTSRLAEIDALAEQFLVQADQLTLNLETHASATTLHVINVSGRQRMLSQRLAKQALLGVLVTGDDAEVRRVQAEETRAMFEQTLDYLAAAPLSTREIRGLLDEASEAWGQLTAALAGVGGLEGQRQLGESSEGLLVLFDRLTAEYERSMQVLMG